MGTTMSETYKELCDVFNVDDASAINNVEKIVKDNGKDIEVLKNKVLNAQKYKLENQEYLKYELQSLIATNNEVLNVLAEQCKVGATPRLFEVYANLSSTIAGHISQLADIDKKITDYQVVEEREKMKREELELKKVTKLPPQLSSDGNVVNIQNNYTFDSETLLDTIMKLNDEKTITNRKKITSVEDLPTFDLS